MNVGFSLLTLFPGRVGGSEANVRGLLAEFGKGPPPARVTVLANRHVMAAYGEFERGPVRLHHVASYRPGDRPLTRALAMAGARAAPGLAARAVPAGLDLVHYPVTVPIPRVAAPAVVTVFDVQHHDLPSLFSRAERRYRLWAYDGAARSATVVVTSSAYSKGRLVELVGLDPERIEVVHLGIELERFRPAPVAGDDELLGRMRLPERFAIYPANLWPHKNHERLIDALAAVSDPELALVLTGQPYGRLGALLERADRLGLRQRVRHLGFVQRDAVPALYRRAAAMVFPSVYEGFGGPPLEAMACGCPVAVSDRGSLPEVCGEAALTFDPEDARSIAAALERVSSDEPLRERLRHDGLVRAAGFSWQAAADAHRAIYARVAGG